MKTETCIAECEAATGWSMKIYQLGAYFRVAIENPEGRGRYSKSLIKTLEGDDADGGLFASVISFFRSEGIEHTGKALVEQARAELKMSEEETTT